MGVARRRVGELGDLAELVVLAGPLALAVAAVGRLAGRLAVPPVVAALAAG